MGGLIQVVCVGKLKGGFRYLAPGIDEYIKRLKPHVSVQMVEIPDESIVEGIPVERLLETEAKRILPMQEKAAYSIALSERGEQLDSVGFSKAFFQKAFGDGLGTNPLNGGIPSGGQNPIIFIVGGALGLSQTVLNKANWVLSLSPMTFPHPMVRLILMEQLFRAYKIHRNESYHK